SPQCGFISFLTSAIKAGAKVIGFVITCISAPPVYKIWYILMELISRYRFNNNNWLDDGNWWPTVRSHFPENPEQIKKSSEQKRL
ncbi:MAG: hypothetical protein LKJ24_02585, partial [Lacticaseibacillus paracasei]|nr:hypothetical protein [Lacticaseibacillus paracasei]